MIIFSLFFQPVLKERTARAVLKTVTRTVADHSRRVTMSMGPVLSAVSLAIKETCVTLVRDITTTEKN